MIECRDIAEKTDDLDFYFLTVDFGTKLYRIEILEKIVIFWYAAFFVGVSDIINGDLHLLAIRWMNITIMDTEKTFYGICN